MSQHQSALPTETAAASSASQQSHAAGLDTRPCPVVMPPLNPEAPAFTPRATCKAPPACSNECSDKARLDWADLDSDDALSCGGDELADARSGFDVTAAYQAACPCKDDGASPPRQSLAEALAGSMLIQSYGGLSQAGSTVSTAEHLSPESSHDSPTPVARQAHNTTVGFSLSTVPEADVARSSSRNEPVPSAFGQSADLSTNMPLGVSETSRRGYAGLLGLAHASGNGCDDTPSMPGIDMVGPSTGDERVNAMVHEAAHGLAAGHAPEAALEGMGGTYFMPNARGAKAAIFKPCDEEPLAPNNPKQWQGRAMGAPGMKPSVRVGEAALREVAAYLLDHNGFAGVPPACLIKCHHPVLNYKVQITRIESLVNQSSVPTAVVDILGATAPPAIAPAQHIAPTPQPAALASMCSGGLSRALLRAPATARTSSPAITPAPPSATARKLGSLQAFAPSKCSADDMSPSHFSANNVHRIGIFDLRVFNCDRHTGNLLVQEAPRISGGASGPGRYLHSAPYSVVPIDHGYALPEALDNPYFEWLFWPQASVPFSDEVKAYVARLDAHVDVAMLRKQLPTLREECLRCLEITTQVLKMCVAAGLTLHEIGSLFTRPEAPRGEPSDLEVLCMDAREEAIAGPEMDLISSGRTSPSVPGSPTSGNVQNVSASALPAVEEVDSDTDSGDIFNISRHGEDMSMCQDAASELSPLIFPMTPRDEHAATASSMGSPPAGFSAAHMCFASMPFATPQLFPFTRDSSASASGAPAPAQSASGVAVTQGPATWGRRGLPRARRNAWRTKHAARHNMAAYPPLLPGTHPDQVNYVFSDLTDTQWRVFVARVEEYVEEELTQGTWKAPRTGPLAGSCPVAFNRRLR